MRALLVVLCFAGMASAHAGIDESGISFAGPGCPADGQGIRVTHSSTEEGRLIIYTPDMSVSLNEGAAFDREACNIVIPVSVGPNERLVLGNPAVFGKESLSTGETLSAKASVFLVGQTGPEVLAEITGNGNNSSDYYKRELAEETLACGQGGLVRASSSLLAQKATTYASGSATLRGLAFDVRIEACN